MTMRNDEIEATEPRAYARIDYLGPVAPHWDVVAIDGDITAINEFRQRVMARLQLLPPYDPQFQRNRTRVVRDAERELISLQWDDGFGDQG